MTLPAQLRAIADRIEAAEAERRAAIAQLAEFAGGAYNIIDTLGVALDADVAEVMRDGSSIEPIEQRSQVAAEDQPAEGHASPPASSPAPIPAAEQVAAGTRAADQLEATPAPARTWKPEQKERVSCPECGKEIAAGAMGVHRRHAHDHQASPARQGRCPECGETLADRKNLPRHRRTQHGVEPWIPKPQGTAAPAPVIRKGAEWFVCARCPLKFPTREARDRHQVTHPPIPEPGPLRSIGRGGG